MKRVLNYIWNVAIPYFTLGVLFGMEFKLQFTYKV